MLELIGRLHPLILHLPIGILALVYLLEVYAKVSRKDLDEVLSFSLLVAAISSSLSVATGLLLVRGGDYGGDLVNNHKWMAIGLMSVCWALYVVQFRHRNIPYYIVLASSAIMLAVTGHLGGSITHGEDFLSKSNKLQVRPSLEQASLYDDIIHPIFKEKCISCHKDTKLKGDLNMSTPELLMVGGEGGVILAAGNSHESVLWERMNMDPSMEEHMPPEGKKQLSGEEKQLIEWWIDSGADFSELVSATEGYEKHKEVAKKFLAPPAVDIFSRVEAPDSSVISAMVRKGIKVKTLHAGSSGVYVNFANDAHLTSRKLRDLRKIRNNISHLNLADTPLNDDLVGQIKKYKNLQKLELQNTDVTSEGIRKLGSLEHLVTLNLYGTKVDSNVIQYLTELPQLRNVYLWKTTMTSSDIVKLQEARPRLNIVHEVNKDIFAEAQLQTPTIHADTEIFEDSLEVSLSLTLAGVDIMYQVSGQDTISYTGPFKIGRTSTISAMARKEGWNDSEVAVKSFLKKGHAVEDITLHNKPHKRYKDFAEEVLSNNTLGGMLFSDGQWVGFQASHARMTLRLPEVKEVSNITVGAFESTSSYIFFPKSVQISFSEDGKKYARVAEKEFDVSPKPGGPKRKNISIEVESKKARWVRVDVLSHLKNPEWHAAPGADCWIFIDEIILN